MRIRMKPYRVELIDKRTGEVIHTKDVTHHNAQMLKQFFKTNVVKPHDLPTTTIKVRLIKPTPKKQLYINFEQ